MPVWDPGGPQLAEAQNTHIPPTPNAPSRTHASNAIDDGRTRVWDGAMTQPKAPPLWAIDAVKNLSLGMTRVQRNLAPSSATLLELVSGLWRPYAIAAIAELGVADTLKGGPKDIAEIAREVGADEESLFRVCRLLAKDGVLEQPEERRFGLTALSEPLCSDHPNSVRCSVRQFLSRWNLASWAELPEVLRSGEPAFPRLHGGRSLWQWFADEAPEDGAVFHASMRELTRMLVPLLAGVRDFSKYGRILDVGGGEGALIGGLLTHFREPFGGILDWEEALRGAPAHLESLRVADRVKLIPGSFEEPWPADWDAYLVKSILHGLRGDALQTVLGHLRGAIAGGGKGFVLEALIPEAKRGVAPSYLELQMLIGSGGRERTVSEYRELFRSAGLRLSDVHRTASPIAMMVVEAL